jgi:Ser/Thr protein kinase RdoA (MazF antagonist)
MNESLLQKIEESYPVSGKVRLVQKVEQGYLSHNYIVSDDGRRYFLKQYTIPLDRIEGAHRTKKFFAEGGIPVVMPLQGNDGQTYFSHAGLYYALFPFVDGKQFERLRMSGPALRSAGEWLARIHLLSKGGRA